MVSMPIYYSLSFRCIYSYQYHFNVTVHVSISVKTKLFSLYDCSFFLYQQHQELYCSPNMTISYYVFLILTNQRCKSNNCSVCLVRFFDCLCSNSSRDLESYMLLLGQCYSPEMSKSLWFVSSYITTISSAVRMRSSFLHLYLLSRCS